tara:strand:- start:4730 stop:6565 length:1836 start_codon:yes stop_codon:yes gene_type:complete
MATEAEAARKKAFSNFVTRKFKNKKQEDEFVKALGAATKAAQFNKKQNQQLSYFNREMQQQMTDGAKRRQTRAMAQSMGAITTDQDLKNEMGSLAAGMQGGVPQMNVVLGDRRPEEVIPDSESAAFDTELMDRTGKFLDTRPIIQTGFGERRIGQDPFKKASRTKAADASVGLTRTDPETGEILRDYRRPDSDRTDPVTGEPLRLGEVTDIERVRDQLLAERPITGYDEAGQPIYGSAIDAAQITGDPSVVDPTGFSKGTLSTGATGTAPSAELDERATVKYQMENLLSSIEEGKPLPAWASPAMRKVSSIMQARGLGASSMAAAAMTQAIMESGVPIAARDAQSYANLQLQELKGEQQMALQNALQIAGMDKANLSARLQAGVTNAQLLLKKDTSNMSATQRSNELSFNALTQAIFKDGAEENLRSQVNAKNDMQVEQVYAQLGAQVETADANRTAGMEQFNAGEANAMSQFNARRRDADAQFDARMSFAIEQSDVGWRRAVNTADTALQNETNRIDTQRLFDASQTALATLWQKYRDNAAWNFQKSESILQRQHEIGIMAMEFSNSKELYDQTQKDNIALGVGNWVATWLAENGIPDFASPTGDADETS